MPLRKSNPWPPNEDDALELGVSVCLTNVDPGITAPTASHNGRNVALAVPTCLFLSPCPPSLERVSHPRLPQ